MIKLPPASSKEIHLFIIRSPLERQTKAAERAMEFLSDKEKALANRFSNPKARWSFVYRRAARRVVLGKALEVSPEKLDFVEGQWRKPVLSESRISFNCSSSGEFIFIGYCKDEACSIGVDIECRQPFPNWERVMKRHTPELLLKERVEFPIFLRQWAKKEAYLKAVGLGLSIEPSELRMPLSNRGSFKEPLSGDIYQIASLAGTTEFEAAVCYRGSIRESRRSNLDFENLDWIADFS
jgi:4'-phosphopantetheinyl transferase